MWIFQKITLSKQDDSGHAKFCTQKPKLGENHGQQDRHKIHYVSESTK